MYIVKYIGKWYVVWFLYVGIYVVRWDFCFVLCWIYECVVFEDCLIRILVVIWEVVFWWDIIGFCLYYFYGVICVCCEFVVVDEDNFIGLFEVIYYYGYEVWYIISFGFFLFG